jgi:hypothetical protein
MYKLLVTAWKMFLSTIVILVLIDLIALPFARHLTFQNSQAMAPGWNYAPWGPELSSEVDRIRLVWYPWCYWRTAPTPGPYIKVGKDGLRRTWKAQSEPGASARLRIVMFGGSTTFGIGARDDHTIPSELARYLAKEGFSNVEVVNAGEPGYVNTQEVIAFLEDLREGGKPTVVIFYDGINDTFAAYQNGRAGVSENEMNRAREFNILNIHIPSEQRALYRAAIVSFVASSSLGVLARAMLRHHSGKAYQREKAIFRVGMPTAQATSDRLAKEVVRIYLDNVRLVAATAKGLGIRALFYWQPVVFSRSPLSPWEKQIEGVMEESTPGYGEFSARTYKAMDESIKSNVPGSAEVRDISGILNNVKGTCFVDPLHIRESCNAVVAARMAQDVIPILKQRAP